MNIYVGHLSNSATEEALKSLFEQYGQVTSVKIIKDKFTGSPRGFAFIEMNSSEEAHQAINKLNNAEFQGQRLRVNEALPPKPRDSRDSSSSRDSSRDMRGDSRGPRNRY